MSSRDLILERIREALGVSRSFSELPALHQVQEVVPTVAHDQNSMRDEFLRQSTALKTEVYICKDIAEASALLRDIALQNEWKKAARHAGSLIDVVSERLPCVTLSMNEEVNVVDLEACDAGITECEALVASSGSILVTSDSSGGRALSVLPPHHLVIAHVHQFVPDLSAAFARLKKKYKADYPEFTSFITGPSRTGDIERILVLGAHGPRRLTVLLIQDEE